MTRKRKSLRGNRRSRSSDRRRRGGYVLVFVAMLLFGLMAMAALVIDIGFARLTQRQMQTAVDSAALEGLRGEGVSTYDERQEAAENLVAWQFDDDLDATNGDAGLGGAFGAGPIVDFSGGAGEPTLVASQLMTVDSHNTVFKPVMQRGEETSGTFRVTIHRGGEFDEEADLFAQGPSVPYLFARGSLINRELVRRGITVRAKSVASPFPAVCVGGDQRLGRFGALGVAYEKTKWLMNDLNNPLTFHGATLGDSVTAVNAARPSRRGYVGIYDDTMKRVIAFGAVGPGSNGIVEKLQVGPNRLMPIAEGNASSAFLFALLSRGEDHNMPPLERFNMIKLVLASHKAFLNELKSMGRNVTAQQILHAPALVN